MANTVITIFGNAGHGKDALAKALKEVVYNNYFESIYQYGCYTTSFAEPMKDVAEALLGMPEKIHTGRDISGEERNVLRAQWRRYDKNAREWLQWIGTELGRDQIDKDIWVDRVVDKILDPANGYLTFVTDGRFHNEFAMRDRLRLLGVRAYNIRVHRPDVAVNAFHQSEAELLEMRDEDFDFVVVNDQDVENLEVAAEKILKKIFG